ncbi:hypothetical protein P8V03_01835 [Clostridium sp. A1-XYC3]|uniref:Uncharacterized protein n=1 Tax=Clostridium tanneri TaxID=3037988 RepID=A0ABU4JP10_9CLOT|nr:hypothetical protein [Clostridium sp. A1-XYC3]MDW8799892.1 hypothetical protein [Clostridium sp. A1-XYC3]
MQEKTKNINNNQDKLEKPKKEKGDKRESCKFLFDMIGRVFSK